MSRTTTGALIILLALIAAGWILSRPAGTDQEQIVRLLKDTQTAVARKNLSRVLSFLSEDYRGAGGSKKEVRLLLLQALRDNEIALTLDTPAVTVRDDQAAVEVFARASVRSESGTDSQFSSDVTLGLRKEDARRFLVFPTRAWRITAANIKTGMENYF